MLKQYFYYCLLKPLKKWVKRIMKRDNDEDDHLNHPYAIF
jgi:hypothetical protein